MTAPFAPPPPWPLKVILLGAIVLALLMPFARREGWLGWIVLGVVGAFGVLLWGMLIWGGGRAIWECWRRKHGDRSDAPDSDNSLRS